MILNQSSNRTNRSFMVGVMMMLLSLFVLQANASTARAQSTGSFGGAILDLVPASGSTISNTLSTGSAGAFLITGNVYLRGTASNCAAIPSPDVFVNFADGARRVGTWRMWGYRLDPALNTPSTSSATNPNLVNISGGRLAVVNMSIDLDSYNGTIQLQGTLGRVFGAIESTGHPLTDILAITGGTGTYRSASGDATLTPVTNQAGDANCASGAFQVALLEGSKGPRFGNVFP
jgi:hypothetical protein